MANCMFERYLSLKLLFHIVFCCCYQVYGELKIIKFGEDISQSSALKGLIFLNYRTLLHFETSDSYATPVEKGQNFAFFISCKMPESVFLCQTRPNL